MVKVFIAAVALCGLVACNQTKEQNNAETAAPQEQVEQVAVSYAGVYKGVLPCASCEGIETTLTIVDDQNANYGTKYLGEEGSEYAERQGKYTVVDSVLTLELEGEKLYFALVDGGVKALDAEAKPIEGELAENYFLKKN